MSELVMMEREDWVKSAKAKESGDEPDPLRKGFVSKIRKVDMDNRSFEMVISTEAVDRDGDVISVRGWSLKDFRKNPVVQWAHNHSIPAIARSIKIGTDDDMLVGEPKFPTEGVHPFADMIFNLYVEHVINASSVGFIPRKFEPLDPEDDSFFAPLRFLKQDLLEFSLVNVPSNPEALGRAKTLGIDISLLRDWAMEVLDGEEGEGGVWMPRSKIARALQIVENDRTAVPMDGYKLVPGTKEHEAIVVLEIPIPAELNLSAVELDRRLSPETMDETTNLVTNALMAEPEEDIIVASTDEKGALQAITLSRIECSHCEEGSHADLTASVLNANKGEFFVNCPETKKPIILRLSDIVGTKEPVEPVDPSDPVSADDGGGHKESDDELTFEKADGAQLLDSFLGGGVNNDKSNKEPDDFERGVGAAIKSAITDSAKEAVREHLTSVTGKLD